MARPMTPDQWLKALRAEGVTDIVEMPGWRTNNRNHKGSWGDVHATMIHHTAGEGTGLPTWCFNGNAALPGPLCHDFLARSGRLYLVGNGRANHAGTVARNAYDAVRNESARHPAPDAAEPIDGNAISYGLECENDGSPARTWPAKQYDVAVRVQAARCRFHGWSADSVWAHKEATRRKPVDPRLPMDQFRRDVAERLAHPASWSPGDASTSPSKEDDMPLSDADIRKVADAVVDRLLGKDVFDAPADAADYSPDPKSPRHYWSGRSVFADLVTRTRRIDRALAALTKKES
ncbi:N-acetylmuramoyl-L-alanine amidase [Streptomyces californicus]|uniref:peptidoglycan recognition protein family protein n=1 Tax=Streptomyces californicus TaxID=67351 RepID=UPI00296FCC23|nr:N-acetylmuramoyl-L-alanine amidase [Streptomyces californicus]MDW4900678.1 N-acetylmuramoyl-L-alanine amidase [Streptomyces californicus]